MQNSFTMVLRDNYSFRMNRKVAADGKFIRFTREFHVDVQFSEKALAPIESRFCDVVVATMATFIILLL